MYTRTLTRALDHHDVRDLNEAVHFAEKIGTPLNATINVHPSALTTYPSDIGRWVSWLTNKIRIWCQRHSFSYRAVWVRENYEGERREHLHVILYLPAQHRDALEAALVRWLPGKPGVVQLGRVEYRRDRQGRRTNKALTYVLKQMTPQAWAALNRQVRREKHNRYDGALVAPVLGARHGVSRSLNAQTRRQLYDAPRVDLRAVRQDQPLDLSETSSSAKRA